MHPVEGHPGPAQALDAFVAATSAGTENGEAFECESARTLRIDVDGDVWLKPGAAIAYRGELAFERRPTLEAETPLDAILREAAPLVRTVGRGRLYCAHHGSHVRVVRLSAEALVVNWEEILAFETSLAFEPQLVGHGVGLAAGGLAVVRLSGDGLVALATHGQPLTLRVTPGAPVRTDPHATLAWSSSLEPTLKFDVTWRSMVAHGGREPVQMQFAGEGFVIVQPFEDPARIHLRANPLKRLAALAGG
ncbi:MAG: AIM24 family protein [Vicinamibacterales bacterium]